MMTIHLPLDQNAREPFCGATLQPGDFVSMVGPTTGACVDCLSLSAIVMTEAMDRIKHHMRVTGEHSVPRAHLGDEARRVRSEILRVGRLKWKPKGRP